jgi:hypothetical protein
MTAFERGFRDTILKLAEEPSIRVVLREVLEDKDTKQEKPSFADNSTATSATNLTSRSSSSCGGSSTTNRVQTAASNKTKTSSR